jgi:hypothetical protein
MQLARRIWTPVSADTQQTFTRLVEVSGSPFTGDARRELEHSEDVAARSVKPQKECGAAVSARSALQLVPKR